MESNDYAKSSWSDNYVNIVTSQNIQERLNKMCVSTSFFLSAHFKPMFFFFFLVQNFFPLHWVSCLKVHSSFSIPWGKVRRWTEKYRRMLLKAWTSLEIVLIKFFFYRVTCTSDQGHLLLRLAALFPFTAICKWRPFVDCLIIFFLFYPSGLQSDRAGWEDQCSQSSTTEEGEWIWAWIWNTVSTITYARTNVHCVYFCICNMSFISRPEKLYASKQFCSYEIILFYK